MLMCIQRQEHICTQRQEHVCIQRLDPSPALLLALCRHNLPIVSSCPLVLDKPNPFPHISEGHGHSPLSMLSSSVHSILI